MLVIFKVVARDTNLNEKRIIGGKCIVFLCDRQFKVLDLS